MSEIPFSFTTAGGDYVYRISSNVILHLHRFNHSIAILEFKDEMNDRTNIPAGFIIYTRDYATNQSVVQKPIDNIYALCWSDDYIVKLNNKLLLDIKNERTWVLHNGMEEESA